MCDIMAANVLRIGDGWAFNELSARNKSTVNEQIVEILIHSSIDNFQRGQLPTANKKLMKCTSRPAIANAMLPDVSFCH
jgi:hypothetical protein